MSKGELLYFKGMKMPESEEEESENEDIWDDSKLTAAYDKAVSMANAEIARRVAMSTNNSEDGWKKEQTPTKSSKKSKPSKNPHEEQGSAIKWKAGMACSAVYDCDGLEYESFILRIINDEECVVRFLGYENSEIVAINTLKPSLGREARAKQIREALDFAAERPDEENTPDTPKSGNNMEVESDRIHSEASSGSHHRKKKSSKKKKHGSGFEVPRGVPMGFPMPVPNMADFMNAGVPEMPIPPPPVSLLRGAPPSADQALSSMLLSWYMSGYCTGYYQGITGSKESRRKN